MAPTQVCCSGEKRLLLTRPTPEVLSIEEQACVPKHRLSFEAMLNIITPFVVVVVW